jgi:hypothetical protein
MDELAVLDELVMPLNVLESEGWYMSWQDSAAAWLYKKY